MVGGGNMAVQMAIELAGMAKQVDPSSASELKADEANLSRLAKKENINTLKGYEVAALHGEGFLNGITIRERATRQETRLDSTASSPDRMAAEHRLPRRARRPERPGQIVVDENCHTSVPGVYAAGDVTSINSTDHYRRGRGREGRARGLCLGLHALTRRSPAPLFTERADESVHGDIEAGRHLRGR